MLYKSLLQQLFIRGGSVIFSLYLFSLYSISLTVKQRVLIYTIVFMLGFFINFGRNVFLVGLGGEVNKKSTAVVSAICGSFGIIYKAAPFIGLAAFCFFIWSDLGFLFSLLYSLLVFFSIFSNDIYRVSLGKYAVSNFFYLLGTLISIVTLSKFQNNLEIALISAALQWIPTAADGVLVLRRFTKLKSNKKPEGKFVLGMTLFSTLDSVLLNFPFFGFMVLAESAKIDYSLTVRFFVASLPLVSILIQNSYSSSFNKHLSKFSVDRRMFLFLSSATSGLISCGIFSLLFKYWTDQDVKFSNFGLGIMMFVAYSAYYVELRSSNLRKVTLRSLFGVPGILMLVILFVIWISYFIDFPMFALAIFISAMFIFLSRLIRIIGAVQ